MYQAALGKSGYTYKLRFNPKYNREKPRRKRKRNITWYNPPFDTRVKTNLGKKFLRIVCECFPRGHALRPIFNRNILKLSYSCMPNVKSTIDAHNKRLLIKASQPKREHKRRQSLQLPQERGLPVREPVLHKRHHIPSHCNNRAGERMLRGSNGHRFQV